MRLWLISVTQSNCREVCSPVQPMFTASKKENLVNYNISTPCVSSEPNQIFNENNHNSKNNCKLNKYFIQNRTEEDKLNA